MFVLVCMLLSSTFAQYCPAIWDPVCGIHLLDRSVRTFSNLCELENQQENVGLGSYRLLHNGACNPYEQGGSNCPAIYQPVCGASVRTGIQRTFSNECVLRNDLGIYRLVHEGECWGSSQACTREWAPVCGIDVEGNQRTFSNECLLRNEGGGLYQFLHPGDCSLGLQGIQPLGRSLGLPIEDIGVGQVCSYIWRPVCGVRYHDSDQKTFSNICLLRNQQTWNPIARYVFLHEGECNNWSPLPVEPWQPQPWGQQRYIGGGGSVQVHDHQDHEESSITPYGGVHSETSSTDRTESDSSPNPYVSYGSYRRPNWGTLPIRPYGYGQQQYIGNGGYGQQQYIGNLGYGQQQYIGGRYGQQQYIGGGGSYYRPQILPLPVQSSEHDHQDHEEQSTSPYGGTHASSTASSHSESNSAPNIYQQRYIGQRLY